MTNPESTVRSLGWIDKAKKRHASSKNGSEGNGKGERMLLRREKKKGMDKGNIRGVSVRTKLNRR